MTQIPDISVFVISYNTGDLLKQCFDSLLAQKDVSLEIIVVDNASQDNSAEIIQSYGDKLTFIASQENLGFTKGNNLAAKQAKGRFYYLLNPDAYLTDEHDLKNLLIHMKRHPRSGLLGTPLLDKNNHNEGQPKYRYPDQQHLKHPLPKLPGHIAWVIGASVLIPAKIYKDISGFDEDFFLYGDDPDLCLRVRKAGYSIDYCEHVKVFHLGGGSERTTGIYEYTLKKQKALHLFYKKHYHPDDQKALIKKNRYRATFRSLVYRFLFTVTRQAKYRHKFERYSAIRDSSKI